MSKKRTPITDRLNKTVKVEMPKLKVKELETFLLPKEWDGFSVTDKGLVYTKKNK